jgi:hypothetical protein
MGKDEKALHRLWREKRGEEASPDLSGVLSVQLGLVTEDLNRRWNEPNSGHRVGDIQRHAIHRTIPWTAATLDGLVKETGAVFEAKFMLPWSSRRRGLRRYATMHAATAWPSISGTILPSTMTSRSSRRSSRKAKKS